MTKFLLVGIENEKEIVKSLDNKRYHELNLNLQGMISKIFKNVLPNDLIKAKKIDDYGKPDIVISIKDEERYVSIKHGKAEIVQGEDLDLFCAWLREEMISEETIETIRLYHFGDGTIDGSGKIRYTYHEIFDKMKDRIAAANIELNRRDEFVRKFLRRALFVGTNEETKPADCIYVGDSEFGYIASKYMVLTHVRRRSYNHISNLHIGPLLLRPSNRYSHREILDERLRNRISAYWPHLDAEIRYISEHYHNSNQYY